MVFFEINKFAQRIEIYSVGLPYVIPSLCAEAMRQYVTSRYVVRQRLRCMNIFRVHASIVCEFHPSARNCYVSMFNIRRFNPLSGGSGCGCFYQFAR